MTYPPAIPPATRTDATLMATSHAADHNQLSQAVDDIVDELGATPAGPYADLTSRLADVDSRLGALPSPAELAGVAHTSPRPVNVIDRDNPLLEAVGTNVSTPLSSRFGSLAEAQAVFPHAVALTDELDWAALQSAIGSGASVDVPKTAGYLVNRPLTANTNGQRIAGDNAQAGSLIKASVAMAHVIELLGNYTELEGIRFHGNSLADYCVRLSNARTSLLRRVVAVLSKSHGFYQADPKPNAYTNNHIHAINCFAQSCGTTGIGGDGWHVADCPTDSAPDQTSLRLTEFEARTNKGSGVMARGPALRIDGGLMQGNSRYGIELGQTIATGAAANDNMVTQEGYILSPRVEANTLGPLNEGAGVRFTIDLRDDWALDPGYVAGSGNWRRYVDSTGLRFATSGGKLVTFQQSNGNVLLGADLSVLTGGVTARRIVRPMAFLSAATTISDLTSDTLGRDWFRVRTAGGAFTVTLPTPVNGDEVTIVKDDSSANACTVAAAGGGSIIGSKGSGKVASITLTQQNEVVTLKSDGSSWFVHRN